MPDSHWPRATQQSSVGWGPNAARSGGQVNFGQAFESGRVIDGEVDGK